MSPNWMASPAGPGARMLSGLGWAVLGTFAVVIAAMFGLLIWAIARSRRGSLHDHAPWTEGGGKGWLVIGGIVIPGVVLIAALIGSLVVMHDAPLDHHQHGEHAMAMKAQPDITILGHQWWWELHYHGDTPDRDFIGANEVHIPTGRPITIQLESRDVIHSFWVPQLHGKVDLIPGYSNRLVLQADEPGRYEGQCSEYCGEQHALMRIAVVAQTPEEYQRWADRQRLPAEHPTEEPAIEGEHVFETRACGMCHAVRGTHALGTVGPDLTHLAGRAAIGANWVKNSHAYLAGWVLRAQSIKPEVKMPNLDQMTGDELTALVAYLRGLQ